MFCVTGQRGLTGFEWVGGGRREGKEKVVRVGEGGGEGGGGCAAPPPFVYTGNGPYVACTVGCTWLVCNLRAA